MKQRFKTVEEFIQSVMSGDKWGIDGTEEEYFYDSEEVQPFRTQHYPMQESWAQVLTKEFTLVEPKPIIERRWMMLKTEEDHTVTSKYYYSQEVIDSDWYGWHKHPTNFIDVQLPYNGV